MATTVPKPVATTDTVLSLPASSPFPSVIIYGYEGQLYYSNPFDSAVPSETWRQIPANTAAPLTAPSLQSSLNFWWNGGTATTIGVFELQNGQSVFTNGKAVSTEYVFHQAILSPSPINTITTTGPTTSGTTTASSTASPSGSSSGQISPTPTSAPNKGLKGGAVAGVAIGCLIAGALIASLLAWFFWKRRKPLVVRDTEASTIALMPREKGPAVKSLSLESGSPITAAMENGLPQPLEDNAITGEISKISNLIKNHVQSYYHAGRVSPGLVDYDDIQALGSDIPVSVGTLSTLLGNSATREIALRFCIAWVVISRMQVQSPANETFLPPEIAKCFQETSALNNGPRGKLIRSHCQSKLTQAVHSLLSAKWRAITAELTQSRYARNPFTADDSRLQNIQSAARILENVLRSYSDSRMDNGQRIQNLEEILKRAAQFAFTLFSQPSSFHFDWQKGEGVKSGSLCIFPALVQVTDENGTSIQPPRPFSDAVVRRLDE